MTYTINGKDYTMEEALKMIDTLNRWDEVETEDYERLCEDLDIDYKSYDDPDKLFRDMCKAAKVEI